MKIVLFQPQIPQNTGNVLRTCSVTGNDLILVTPLGFSTSSRMLKRAGLDYWEGVSVKIIDDLEALLTDDNFFFFSSKATKIYTEPKYNADSILIFGSETSGLPKEYHDKWPDHFYKIPMLEESRCLNLASSAAVVTYESWRHINFGQDK
jgi:tRNA (cytidine/uridine-2'-O-)-methyltransferase